MRVSAREIGLGFEYDLELVSTDTPVADDEVVHTSDFDVLVDSKSAEMLRGATIDWVSSLEESGFRFENPNTPATASIPVVARVQAVIDQEINPSLAAHGGRVSLISVEADRAYIQMGGGCQGCGQADQTFKLAIAEMLTSSVPEISRVIDTTDHAEGENPYYQPEG